MWQQIAGLLLLLLLRDLEGTSSDKKYRRSPAVEESFGHFQSCLLLANKQEPKMHKKSEKGRSRCRGVKEGTGRKIDRSL